MNVRCPVCQKSVELPLEDAGRLVLCTACGERFRAADLGPGRPAAEPGLSPAAAPEDAPRRHEIASKWPIAAGMVIGLALLIGALVLAVHASRGSAPDRTMAAANRAMAVPKPRMARPDRPRDLPGGGNRTISSQAIAAGQPASGHPASSNPAPVSTSANALAPVLEAPASEAPPSPVSPAPAAPTSRQTTESRPPTVPKPAPRIAASPVIPRPPIHPIALAPADLTDAQIGSAIQMGVDALLGQFDWRTHMLSPALDDQLGIVKGEDILCVYALMQSGEAIDDPRLNPRGPLMRGLIAAMKGIPLHDYGYETYARGLRATALALYDRPEDRLALKTDTDALVKGARAGAYTYTLTHQALLRGLLGNWDNSNSQYGLLGVWSAAEVGIEVPQTYWEQVSRHWTKSQVRNGQWGYETRRTDGSYSMTCAGLASLLVCYDYFNSARMVGNVGRDPFTRPIARGLAWLETADNCVTITPRYPGYGLYGLERVGLATGFKYFGHHDWYRELAIKAVHEQQSDGSWGSVVDTAYHLLFLARGRHPVLMNKLRFDGYWANRPRDLANLTRFTSHQLERPLNWQVVPLTRPWTDWADSPILYMASHVRVKLTDADCDKIRSFVDNGGLLFTQADGNSLTFNKFAAELAHRLFPAYEMTDLPPSHPLCSVMFKFRPPESLKIVSNGSRILMLHSMADVSRYWQIRDDKRTPFPFELGTNLFVYAAGKRDFRNRLVSNHLAAPIAAPARTFRVARLSYAGNWNPEPAAWGRFARWFQSQTGYGLDVVQVPIAKLTPALAPIADLTGTARYELTNAEADAIKRYVDAGGVVLIDTCGGRGAFDPGLQSSLYSKVFPDSAPQTIFPSNPLLAGDASAGMDDLSRPRLRPFATDILGHNAGLPEELRSGRGHVIRTPLDLTTALLATNTWGILGYDPSYAQSFVKNVILWTLDGQRDEDSN